MAFSGCVLVAEVSSRDTLPCILADTAQLLPVIHAEMPVHAPGYPDPRGLQLWVDLPKQYKMVEPSYQELGPQEIPTAYPEGSEGPVKVKVISGKSFGVESPVRPLGGCWFFHVIFDKKATIFQPIRES